MKYSIKVLTCQLQLLLSAQARISMRNLFHCWYVKEDGHEIEVDQQKHDLHIFLHILILIGSRSSRENYTR